MPQTRLANGDQGSHWNDLAGRTWADLSDMLDRVLEPLKALLMDEISPVDGARILDVGCGAGAVTLASSKVAGPGGSCLGIDISEPLIDAARARAKGLDSAGATFIRGDAQTYPFVPGSFDAIISRFGIMFFDDPTAAFRNLRAAARPGAKLACLAWRSAAENVFMTTAERAAADIVPDFPQRDERGPGQFAFARRDYVQGILEASGWQAIEIRPIDVTCEMPRRDLGTYVTRMGPLGAVFHSLDHKAKAEIAPRIEAAFEPFIDDGMVRFTAACWMMTARA
jgi:SAM-dependent methyltransferase